MDGIRKSVDEIMGAVSTKGQVSLGEAKEICDRNGAMLHNVLAELDVRCQVDYHKGVILCRSQE